MKKVCFLGFVVSISMLVSLSFAFADTTVDGERAQQIFDALQVRAVRTNPRLGVEVIEKNIGGLICKISHGVYPGAQYRYVCTLGELNYSKYIYEALVVEEEPIRDGRVGMQKWTKSVAGLNCTKSQVPYPGLRPHFDCMLQEDEPEAVEVHES